MSAAKHTPGPWTGGDNHPRKSSNFGDYSVRIVGGKLERVAKVYGGAQDDQKVCAANAKLIATAPALADRLQFDNALLKRLARFLDTSADADELLDDVNGAIGHNDVALRAAGRLP